MDVVTPQNTNPFGASHSSHASRSRSPASSSGHQRPNSASSVTSSVAGHLSYELVEFECRKGNLRRASTGNYHSHNYHQAPSRRFRVRPDVIDRLDDVSTLQYHHEGPYDAVCAERNSCTKSSPVAALRDSNAEILKATPPYKIDDCLHRHRPLDGVAFYPPGTTDPEGNTYHYSEGSNMVTELDTNFMRDPGMKFTDADFANDPFYSGDRVGPLRRISSLRKALSLRKRLRKATAASA
ncbi:hypothetical protein V8E54_005835 [Elaphomyces granulatus]